MAEPNMTLGSFSFARAPRYFIAPFFAWCFSWLLNFPGTSLDIGNVAWISISGVVGYHVYRVVAYLPILSLFDLFGNPENSVRLAIREHVVKLDGNSLSAFECDELFIETMQNEPHNERMHEQSSVIHGFIQTAIVAIAFSALAGFQHKSSLSILFIVASVFFFAISYFLNIGVERYEVRAIERNLSKLRTSASSQNYKVSE